MRRSTDQALVFKAENISAKVSSYDEALESDIRHKALNANIEDFTQKSSAAAAARVAYLDASRQKRDARTALEAKLVRVHGAVIGKFGPESEEFAAIGGKRPSDRKRSRRSRKSTAEAGQPAMQPVVQVQPPAVLSVSSPAHTNGGGTSAHTGS